MDDDVIQQWVQENMMRELKIIEQICEQSVQSGQFGVLITRDQMGILVRAEVHPDVPYGMVHEMRVNVDRSIPTPEEGSTGP